MGSRNGQKYLQGTLFLALPLKFEKYVHFIVCVTQTGLKGDRTPKMGSWSSVAYLGIWKGGPGYVSGVHFQKCLNTSINFFTLNISTNIFFASSVGGGGRHKVHKYAPTSPPFATPLIFQDAHNSNQGISQYHYRYD